MSRNITLLLAVAGTALVLCLVAVLVADASSSDSVAKGVKIGSVDVGGLSAGEARAKVRRKLVAPLRKQLTVPIHGTGRVDLHLTAKESQINANVDKIVDDAVQEGRKGGVVARTWRGLTGGERDVTIKPDIHYRAAAVDRLVQRARRRLDRQPVDAKAQFDPGNISIRPSRNGRRVMVKRFRSAVLAELTSPIADREVPVPTRTARPKVSTSEVADRYPVVVEVNRGGFQLTLYKKLKRVKSYPIAVGQVGLETPAGLYKVSNKAVNPAWTVPNAAWAGSLAGRVIPGGTAENPLKSRWIGVYDGVGVHGTSDSGSIGSNASHGCIRMLIPDVEELYDQVPVGSPIYIH